MKRPLTSRAQRLLAGSVVLAAAAVLTGCGRSNSVAIEVDGRSISITDFEREVDAVAGNEKLLEGQPAILVDGEPAPDFVANWAGRTVQQMIIDDEFDARGLSVTKAEIDTAREGFIEQNTQEVVDAFPDWFVQQFVEADARARKLSEALAATPAEVSDADIEAAYEQTYTCESGIEVSHILVATQADADAVVAELTGGADFATLAAERSTDPGSAQQGGSLGCFAAGQYVAEFEAGVLAATAGTPTAPVKSEFGFHVILTATFERPPLAEVRDEIVAQLETQAGGTDPLTTLLEARLAEADVEIDPRYGTWSAETGQVTAPDTSSPRDGREAPTQTTVEAGDPTLVPQD